MPLDLHVSESDIARLTFDAEKHEYRYAGRRVPSVTQILTGAGLIDKTWFTEAAAWRGSVVHRCCELDCKGTLVEATVDPAAAGYLVAWRDWKRKTGFTSKLIEERKYNQAFGYCGTPDRVGVLPDGTYAVVDLKTGAPMKWHALQLAAYAKFDQSAVRWRRFTVCLNYDTTYSTEEYYVADLSTDWAAFQCAVQLNNWRLRNGY